MSPDMPPALGARMIKRAALAAVAIVLMTAAAVASAGLLTADDLINAVEREGRAPLEIPENEIDRADAGEAQTIMLLGSDERAGDRERGIKPLSDTILLVRLDPDAASISMTSIPRDLLVEIPGMEGVRNKINYAYKAGGVRLTLKTVKKLLSTEDRPFEVHHVVTVGFVDFRRAVDYIGCVYADIDRDYFNDNSTGTNYATIDIDPGYQKICGDKALDYVRYRHGDTDLVRGARQQDFLRQVKDSAKVRSLLQWSGRKEVAKMAGRFLETSKSLRRKRDLFRLLQLVIFTGGKPIQEVPFRSAPAPDNINIVASRSDIRKTLRQFFAQATSPVPAATPTPSAAQERKRRKRARRSTTLPAGLVDAAQEGQDQALLTIDKRPKFRVLYPTVKTDGAAFDEASPRVYRLRDEVGGRQRAYRLVVDRGLIGEYYGVQGTTWRDPPILDNPSEVRVDPRTGRRLELFYDGKRLRLVAFRTKNAAYWVSNTLTQSLNERQMLAIAGSLRRLGR